MARVVLESVAVHEGGSILVTQDMEQLSQCEHFLLYLHGRTWTRGEESEALGAEVLRAMDLGVHILLAHECDDSGRKAAHCVPFGAFFGTTFPHLFMQTYSELRPQRCSQTS